MNSNTGIIGYTEGDFQIPLFAPAPENTLQDTKRSGKWPTESWLDEKCTEAAERNQLLGMPDFY